MQDFWCPRCEYEFEGRRFDVGQCPSCGNVYQYMGEDCTADFSDCWDVYDWEFYGNEKN